MSATGTSLEDLKAIIKQDEEDSKRLQSRIDELAQKINDKQIVNLPRVLGEMQTQGQAVHKDLLKRLDELDDKPNKDATDRTMQQALNARLVVIDKQIQQMGELKSLMYDAQGGKRDKHGNPVEYDVLEPEKNLGPNEKPRGFWKKVKKDEAPVIESQEEVQMPTAKPIPVAFAPTPAPAHELEPYHAPGPSLDSVAEPIDPRDIGAAPYASEEYDEHHPPPLLEGEEREYEMVYVDEQTGEEFESVQPEGVEEEPLTDKSAWPICYQILDIDPATDAAVFSKACTSSLRKLSLKHSPDRWPNDPSAPARWAAIAKAYETLSDPERKNFYDMHGRTPADLVDFDLSKLSID